MLQTLSLTEKLVQSNLSNQIQELKKNLRRFESAGQLCQINPSDEIAAKIRDSRIRKLLNILPDFVGSLSGFGGSETRYPSKTCWTRGDVINYIDNLEKELAKFNN